MVTSIPQFCLRTKRNTRKQMALSTGWLNERSRLKERTLSLFDKPETHGWRFSLFSNFHTLQMYRRAWCRSGQERVSRFRTRVRDRESDENYQERYRPSGHHVRLFLPVFELLNQKSIIFLLFVLFGWMFRNPGKVRFSIFCLFEGFTKTLTFH